MQPLTSRDGATADSNDGDFEGMQEAWYLSSSRVRCATLKLIRANQY